MAKKYQSSLGEKTIFQNSSLLQHEEVKRHITVIPELEALIPPLSDDEKSQLEANIIKEGCRESLLVWPTTEKVLNASSASATPVYILVDGHNRYRICRQHNIDFSIHFVRYESLDDVKAFMIDNQLGRRNLSAEQASYLRGLKYLNLRQAKGKYDRIEHKDQNDPYGSEIKKTTTAEQLAAEFSVGQATIKRDAEYAQGLEMLSPVLKSAVLSGKSKVSKQVIQQLAKKNTIKEKLGSVEEIDQYLQETPKTNKVTTAKTKAADQEDALLAKINQLLTELKGSPVRNELCEQIISLVSQLKDAAPK